MWLIDFGYNYLLTERVGTTPAFQAVRNQVAPESLDAIGLDEPSIMGDVYSLGILFVECFLGNRYDEVDSKKSIDLVYRQFRGIGATIDDMLDLSPKRRMLGVDRDKIYDFLRNRLTSELDFLIRIAENEKRSLMKSVWLLLEIIIPGAKGLFEWVLRRLKPNLLRYSERDSLFFYASLPVALNILIFSIFWGKIWNTITHLHGWSLSQIPPFLPGWIVAASFSLIATKYYLVIFADNSAERLSNKTEKLIRINCWFYSLPIIFALVINPFTWPMCSAIGYSIVTWNNFECARFCKTASETMSRANITITPDMEELIQKFTNWGILGGMYTLSLLLIGIFLSLGWLKDTFFYAFLVAFVYNTVNYFLNCTREGPKMRTSFSRFLHGYHRATTHTITEDGI